MKADDLLDTLADLLAERVADRVLERLEAAESTNAQPPERLLTIDQLLELLPQSKRPETWRRWLYSKLPSGEVPGAVKLGGTWHFRPSETLAGLGFEGRDE